MNFKKFNIENLSCKNFVYSFKNITEFRKGFREKYNYIIAYHGTNLTIEELDLLKKVGLKLSSKDLLIKRAKSRFFNKNDNFNNKIEENILKYFSNNELSIKNEINFALIKNDLKKNYHYVLFGAESLLPLADYLKNIFHESFRIKLIESSSHYIIKVSIPVDKIDDEWINLIYDYFHESNFAISLTYYFDLPNENIIEIENVKRPDDIYKLIQI